MVTNSIKATGYTYLVSNTGTQTQVQNKSQTDFANVMEKAGENRQNDSVKSTQKSSDTSSKTETVQKVSQEKPKKEVSSQEESAQNNNNVEAAESTTVENEKLPDNNIVETEMDDNVEEEDFIALAENLVQLQLPNEAEPVFDDVSDETTDSPETETWQVTEQVVNRLAEGLQVTTEDIRASMEKLDMNISDLQEPQNLLKLIVDVKDLKGPEEVLTVTGLTETFKELSTELKDILKEQPELSRQEYDASAQQEENPVDTKTTYVMTENSGEEESRGEQKSSDSAKESVHVNSVQTNNTDNSFFVQQTNFNDRVQELLAERVDVQTSESIVRQVIDQVKLNIKTDVTSVQMQLYPEHLGKVAIQVVSKNGVLTAQIAAENEGAKAALESQLNALKESFDNQGLKVQSVEVMVSSRGFDQNTDANSNSSENPKQGRRIRKSLLEELEETETDPEEEDLKSALGNTVSYTA